MPGHPDHVIRLESPSKDPALAAANRAALASGQVRYVPAEKVPSVDVGVALGKFVRDGPAGAEPIQVAEVQKFQKGEALYSRGHGGLIKIGTPEEVAHVGANLAKTAALPDVAFEDAMLTLVKLSNEEFYHGWDNAANTLIDSQAGTLRFVDVQYSPIGHGGPAVEKQPVSTLLFSLLPTFEGTPGASTLEMLANRRVILDKIMRASVSPRVIGELGGAKGIDHNIVRVLAPFELPTPELFPIIDAAADKDHSGLARAVDTVLKDPPALSPRAAATRLGVRGMAEIPGFEAAFSDAVADANQVRAKGDPEFVVTIDTQGKAEILGDPAKQLTPEGRLFAARLAANLDAIENTTLSRETRARKAHALLESLLPPNTYLRADLEVRKRFSDAVIATHEAGQSPIFRLSPAEKRQKLLAAIEAARPMLVKTAPDQIKSIAEAFADRGIRSGIFGKTAAQRSRKRMDAHLPPVELALIDGKLAPGRPVLNHDGTLPVVRLVSKPVQFTLFGKVASSEWQADVTRVRDGKVVTEQVPLARAEDGGAARWAPGYMRHTVEGAHLDAEIALERIPASEPERRQAWIRDHAREQLNRAQKYRSALEADLAEGAAKHAAAELEQKRRELAFTRARIDVLAEHARAGVEWHPPQRLVQAELPLESKAPPAKADPVSKAPSSPIEFIIHGKNPYYKSGPEAPSDTALVDHLATRLLDGNPEHGVKPIAADQGQATLEGLGIAGVRARLRQGGKLTPAERELFAFLQSEPGRAVRFEFGDFKESELSGSWAPTDKGVLRVKVSRDPARMETRTPFEMVKHELSHTLDGYAWLKDGEKHVDQYAMRDHSWHGGHHLLYQEFRANLWAMDGDFDRAREATRMSYRQGKFADGWEPARSVTGRQHYQVLQELTRRYPGENLYEGKHDARYVRVLQELGVPLSTQMQVVADRLVQAEKTLGRKLSRDEADAVHQASRTDDVAERTQILRDGGFRWVQNGVLTPAPPPRTRAQIAELTPEQARAEFRIEPTVGGYLAFLGETVVGQMFTDTVVGVKGEGEVAGRPKALQVGTVWTIPEVRGKGLGALFYQEVARRAPNGLLLSGGKSMVTPAAWKTWSRLADGSTDYKVGDLRSNSDKWTQTQFEKSAAGKRIRAWKRTSKTIDNRPLFTLRAKVGLIEGQRPLVAEEVSQVDRARLEALATELKIDAQEFDVALEPQLLTKPLKAPARDVARDRAQIEANAALSPHDKAAKFAREVELEPGQSVAKLEAAFADPELHLPGESPLFKLTPAEVARKARVLAKRGLTEEQRRYAMDHGYAGTPEPEAPVKVPRGHGGFDVELRGEHLLPLLPHMDLSPWWTEVVKASTDTYGVERLQPYLEWNNLTAKAQARLKTKAPGWAKADAAKRVSALSGFDDLKPEARGEALVEARFRNKSALVRPFKPNAPDWTRGLVFFVDTIGIVEVKLEKPLPAEEAVRKQRALYEFAGIPRGAAVEQLRSVEGEVEWTGHEHHELGFAKADSVRVARAYRANLVARILATAPGFESVLAGGSFEAVRRTEANDLELLSYFNSILAKGVMRVHEDGHWEIRRYPGEPEDLHRELKSLSAKSPEAAIAELEKDTKARLRRSSVLAKVLREHPILDYSLFRDRLGPADLDRVRSRAVADLKRIASVRGEGDASRRFKAVIDEHLSTSPKEALRFYTEGMRQGVPFLTDPLRAWLLGGNAKSTADIQERRTRLESLIATASDASLSTMERSWSDSTWEHLLQGPARKKILVRLSHEFTLPDSLDQLGLWNGLDAVSSSHSRIDFDMETALSAVGRDRDPHTSNWWHYLYFQKAGGRPLSSETQSALWKKIARADDGTYETRRTMGNADALGSLHGHWAAGELERAFWSIENRHSLSAAGQAALAKFAQLSPLDPAGPVGSVITAQLKAAKPAEVVPGKFGGRSVAGPRTVVEANAALSPHDKAAKFAREVELAPGQDLAKLEAAFADPQLHLAGESPVFKLELSEAKRKLRVLDAHGFTEAQKKHALANGYAGWVATDPFALRPEIPAEKSAPTSAPVVFPEWSDGANLRSFREDWSAHLKLLPPEFEEGHAPVPLQIQGRDYLLGDRLGQGGGGVVFRLIQKADESPRLIKIALQPGNTSERFDLRAEARALKLLADKGVATAEMHFVQKDGLYAVKEYLDGQSLGDEIRKLKKLPGSQVVARVETLMDTGLGDLITNIKASGYEAFDLLGKNVRKRSRDGKWVVYDPGELTPGKVQSVGELFKETEKKEAVSPLAAIAAVIHYQRSHPEVKEAVQNSKGELNPVLVTRYLLDPRVGDEESEIKRILTSDLARRSPLDAANLAAVRTLLDPARVIGLPAAQRRLAALHPANHDVRVLTAAQGEFTLIDAQKLSRAPHWAASSEWQHHALAGLAQVEPFGRDGAHVPEELMKSEFAGIRPESVHQAFRAGSHLPLSQVRRLAGTIDRLYLPDGSFNTQSAVEALGDSTLPLGVVERVSALTLRDGKVPAEQFDMAVSRALVAKDYPRALRLLQFSPHEHPARLRELVSTQCCQLEVAQKVLGRYARNADLVPILAEVLSPAGQNVDLAVAHFIDGAHTSPALQSAFPLESTRSVEGIRKLASTSAPAASVPLQMNRASTQSGTVLNPAALLVSGARRVGHALQRVFTSESPSASTPFLVTVRGPDARETRAKVIGLAEDGRVAVRTSDGQGGFNVGRFPASLIRQNNAGVESSLQALADARRTLEAVPVGHTISVDTPKNGKYVGEFHGFNSDGSIRLRDPAGKAVSLDVPVAPGAIRVPAGAQQIARLRSGEMGLPVETDASIDGNPAYAQRVRGWVSRMSGVGIKHGSDASVEKVQAIQREWNRIVPELEAKRPSGAREGEYSRTRDAILAKAQAAGQETVHIEEINRARANVCAELTTNLSAVMAELGMSTRVGRGMIQDNIEGVSHPIASHVWLEVLDAQGKLIGIIDSNATRSFHATLVDYERAYARLTGGKETLTRMAESTLFVSSGMK